MTDPRTVHDEGTRNDRQRQAAASFGNVVQDGTAVLELISANYRRLLSSELGSMSTGEDPGSRRRWLDDAAPFGLLAHDGGTDPRFIYANATAARWFGYNRRTDIVGLPSRLSAGGEAQKDRDDLLQEVTRHGFATGYRGLRRERSGRRFWIEDVTMWNLTDAAGEHVGQAALLPRRVDMDSH